MGDNLLLEVKGLKTYFDVRGGVVKAVDGVDLTVRRGGTLGIVGESGCGKSVTAFSILQLVGRPGKIVAGQVLLHRAVGGNGAGSQMEEVVDLAALPPRGREIRRIRGAEVAMIFQEPMTSLSMMHTIGFQIVEAIRLHAKIGKREARDRAIELLRQVGIPHPERRVDSYPFELSGGMRQRAMIAMALSCRPGLLIADEPTTALDVTTQLQILTLIRNLQQEIGMALMIITHDLGVVAAVADEVAVMYLGWVVERGDVDSIFHDPRHPYTQALLRSIPKVEDGVHERLASIRGRVPAPANRPAGCVFHPRCEKAMPGLCECVEPPRIPLGDGREVRCLLYGKE